MKNIHIYLIKIRFFVHYEQINRINYLVYIPVMLRIGTDDIAYDSHNGIGAIFFM